MSAETSLNNTEVATLVKKLDTATRTPFDISWLSETALQESGVLVMVQRAAPETSVLFRPYRNTQVRHGHTPDCICTTNPWVHRSFRGTEVAHLVSCIDTLCGLGKLSGCVAALVLCISE